MLRLSVLTLLIITSLSKVGAEELRADLALISVSPGQRGQMVLSYGDTREADLVFANQSADCPTNELQCLKIVASFPVIVRNFKAGAGIGISGDKDRTTLVVKNWANGSLKQLFGTYRGISAMAVDLSMFIGIANFRLTDVVAVNRSGALIYQPSELAAKKDHGTEVEVASLRWLQLIPRVERSVSTTAALPDLDLRQN